MVTNGLAVIVAIATGLVMVYLSLVIRRSLRGKNRHSGEEQFWRHICGLCIWICAVVFLIAIDVLLGSHGWPQGI